MAEIPAPSSLALELASAIASTHATSTDSAPTTAPPTSISVPRASELRDVLTQRDAELTHLRQAAAAELAKLEHDEKVLAKAQNMLKEEIETLLPT